MASPKCERCGATHTGRRRKTCPGCKAKVHSSCCWHDGTDQCVKCYGMPESPEEHLARVKERHAEMTAAFEQYEQDCLALWDGDEVSVPRRDPTPFKAWKLWVLAIEEACDAVGIPEDDISVPPEPWQDFPSAPEPGSDDGEYDIRALVEACTPTLAITLLEGGKKKGRRSKKGSKR